MDEHPAQSDGTEAASSALPQDLDAAEIRQMLTQLVLKHAAEILKGSIEKAKSGHYSLTKLLFTLAGIYPGPVASEPEINNSLAEFFCQQLGIPMPERYKAEAVARSAANEHHSLE